MDPKKRIDTIKLIDRMNRQIDYSVKLKIKDKSNFKGDKKHE